MTDLEFNQLIDKTLLNIEEAIDAVDIGADYERQEGVLSIELESGDKIIINQQRPTQQLWLAAKGRAVHFNFLDDQWRCDRSGDTLSQVLEEVIPGLGELSKIN